VLSEFSVQAMIMHDGLQALMRALTETFDLIITTNEIPLLNGVALIGALKLSDSRNRNAKTILITANKNIASIRKRASDADYIIKDAKLPKNLADAARQAFSGMK
jgi:CheY-like chemotaxis protein